MSVSVVIPNRDGGGVLDRCLDALEATTAIDEVIVVDDGSADGSDERARTRGVTVLASAGRGFAAAVNAGVAHARNDHVLILNSDAFVEPETAERLRAALATRPHLALCGAALVHDDGTRARTFGRDLTLSIAVRLCLSLQPRPPREASGIQLVDFVPLACALARRDALASVGGLDERYRFYFEDHDLCWRLRRAGWEIGVCWDARAVHLEGGSSSGRDPQRWFPQFHESRLRYLRKRYERGWLVYLAVWVPTAVAHAAVWLGRASRSRNQSARAWARAYLRAAFSGVRD